MFMIQLRIAQVMLAAALVAADVAAADQPAAKRKTGDEVSPTQFDKLHRLIRPDPKTSFEGVPWLTSLWQARQQAAAEDKPIVLWAGDPLPLGIT